MPGMTAEETASYIPTTSTRRPLRHPVQRRRHRPDPPTSRGLPRAVNNLAIQALIAAYAARKAIVDESSARAAVTEVTAD